MIISGLRSWLSVLWLPVHDHLWAEELAERAVVL
jgi:hypothetical protein